jgi:hypothetical protein
MTVLTIYRTIDGFREVSNDGTTIVQDLDKTPIGTEPWDEQDREWIVRTRPPALDTTGALATLLAVTGTLTVEDAANAVGLLPADLNAEAEAWVVAQQLFDYRSEE